MEEKSRFPRIAGSLMVIAPFFNFLMTISAIDAKDRWSFRVAWSVITSLSAPSILLWTFTIAVGAKILIDNKGHWKVILPIAAAYIFLSIRNFSQGVAAGGWFGPIIPLIANVTFFMMVLWQIVKKTAGPIVYFEGMGPWARLSAVTATHIHLEKIGEPPPNIDKRLLEIEMETGRKVKLRFELQDGTKFVFLRVG